MENFVLAGKAKTVFKLLEIKVQREASEQAKKKLKKDGRKERRD
jgi:hypothetical protein